MCGTKRADPVPDSHSADLLATLMGAYSPGVLGYRMLIAMAEPPMRPALIFVWVGCSYGLQLHPQGRGPLHDEIFNKT